MLNLEDFKSTEEDIKAFTFEFPELLQLFREKLPNISIEDLYFIMNVCTNICPHCYERVHAKCNCYRDD